ncbi:hypothetical protein ACFLRP_01595 [Bacteroidota bacterium]
MRRFTIMVATGQPVIQAFCLATLRAIGWLDNSRRLYHNLLIMVKVNHFIRAD